MAAAYIIFGVASLLSLIWWGYASDYAEIMMAAAPGAKANPAGFANFIFAESLPVILVFSIASAMIFVIFARQVQKSILESQRALAGSGESLAAAAKALAEGRKMSAAQQFFSTLPFIQGDLAATLADFIKSAGAASDVVVFDLQGKSGGERLSALCKMVLDARAETPHFEETLRRRMKKDAAVADLALVFAAKYKALAKAVGRYDLDGIMSRIVEEGELGATATLLARVHALSAAPDEGLRVVE